MNTALAQLHDRLSTLEQENASLRSRLQSCERSHALLQAEVAGYRRHEKDGQEPATEAIAEPVTINSLSTGNRLLEATAKAANALLTVANLDEAVNTALQIIGEALDTDRVAVVENITPLSDRIPIEWKVLSEWHSTYTISQSAHLELSQGTWEGIEEWYACLSGGQSVSRLLEETPEPFRSLSHAIGMMSIHLVPIFVDGKWWGTLGSDDCCEAKRRSATELAVLRIAADCIGSAIQRERTQQALLEVEQARSAELERANNALQGTVAALADRCDLEGFIGEVLHTIAREFESPLVEYWKVLGSDTVEIDTWLCGNQLCSLKQRDEHPGRGGIRLLPEFVEFEDFMHRRKPLVFTELIPAYSLVLGEVICPTEWYGAREVSGHFNFPLQAGNLTVGTINVWLPRDRQVTEECLRLGQALSRQTALAIQLTQLAEEAKQAAIAREQEKAAQERAAELAKANEALQTTIDVMADIEDLDEFIPAVLKIVAQTFQAGQTENCAYYEHGIDDSVYLRYWLFENHVFRPEELLALDGDRFATIRRLAGGFTVPDSYLGTPVRERTQAVILDHVAGTPEPEFDEFTCANGWHMELNVPLFVNGSPEAALVIYRSAGRQFTPAEVTLAESLGKQLALAMQANRLATESKLKAVETAIAREQEKAAQERAAELEKANEAMRRSVERVANSPNPLGVEALLESFLLEAMRTAGASGGAISTWQNGRYVDAICVAQDGAIVPPAEWSREPLFVQAPEIINRDPVGFASRLIAQSISVTTVEEIETWWHDGAEYHRQRDHKEVWNVPLVLRGSLIATLGLAFRENRAVDETTRVTLVALAQQATLALELTRLAEEVTQNAVQAAIAREQEKAAQERATELAKVNEALRRSATGLATITNIDDILTVFLREAIAASGASAGAVLRRVSGTEFEFVAILQGDELLRGQPLHDHPFAIAVRERSRFDVTGYFTRISMGQTVWRLAQDGTDWLPEAAEYHQVHGQQALWDIPFSVGDEVAGYLGLAFRTTDMPSTVVAEAIAALSNQVAVALELTRLADEAKQAAIYEERNRMAREIHDTLAQAFTGISLQLEVAKSLIKENPQAVQQILSHISQLAEAGLTEARRSVWALYPPAAEYADLAQLLYESVEQMTRNTLTSVEVNVQGTPCSLSPFIGMNLLRIGQEALTNALKHAQAKTVKIELVYEPDRILLTIRDNGRGFTPPTTIDNLNGGFGLMGMYERCDRINAQLSLTSQLGQGTQILVEAPC